MLVRLTILNLDIIYSTFMPTKHISCLQGWTFRFMWKHYCSLLFSFSSLFLWSKLGRAFMLRRLSYRLLYTRADKGLMFFPCGDHTTVRKLWEDALSTVCNLSNFPIVHQRVTNQVRYVHGPGPFPAPQGRCILHILTFFCIGLSTFFSFKGSISYPCCIMLLLNGQPTDNHGQATGLYLCI